jgi:AcrR family transcriptional regulator
MCPRRYDSSRRQEAAEANRVRILEAARALVGGKGDLADFSVDAVAKKAGVARMTVYYQFESRAKLLEALADHLAVRGGMARMREVFMATDFETGLRKLIEVFFGFWATDRVTIRRLRAMGIVFPTDSSAAVDRDSWRREAVSNLLQRHRILNRGQKRASNELIDLLTTLTSFETFDALCTSGRRPSEVSRLIGDMAVSTIRRSGDA